MQKTLLAAGVLGASAVALGAYAAHGLAGDVAELGYDDAEVAKRVGSFVTGTRYQLATAVAMLAIALRERRRSVEQAFRVATGMLAFGTAMFCGSLYALAFVGSDLRWLGAVAPIGGLSLMLGWATLAFAGFKHGESHDAPGPAADGANPDRTTRLEELAAFQQKTIDDLNATVTAVRDEMDAANRKFEALTESVRRLAETQRATESPGDEKPPHY